MTKQMGPFDELLAEFRALSAKLELKRLPTLLSYSDAARELGLGLTQFKVRYVRTGRIVVFREPHMHPRVPASEIQRIVGELKAAAEKPKAAGPKPRRALAGNASEADLEVEKLKAIRAKRRRGR